ncbi:MAG TPA: hypothetical protein VL588_04305 [Bdellovibrionota bacterium]|nr:hypothetical protein [Bdellovibrionota bacterium]
MNSSARGKKVIGPVLSLGIALASAGCGQFGDKLDKSRILNYTDAATGCLNTFGSQLTKYMSGDVDPDEWSKTWDCVVGSIDTFRDFVAGSTPGGYTVDDLYGFVHTFLVTNKPITRELVTATFRLKASVIGGSDQRVTFAELDTFKSLLAEGKIVSLGLIPNLRARAQNPTRQNLLDFAAAVGRGTAVIGSKVKNLPGTKIPFLVSDVTSLFNTLSGTFGWDLKTEWIGPLMAGKGILLAGSSDQIDPGQWGQFLEVGGHLAAAAAAGASASDDYMQGPNERGAFIVGLAQEARKSLDGALAAHGGRVPLARFDALIDSIPTHWLDALNKVNKEVLKDSLRPMLRKILWSKDTQSIGSETLDLLYKKMDMWNVGQTHLETIFHNYHLDPSGVTTQQFVESANDYVTTIPDDQVASVRRLIGLATDYRPLFVGDDLQISFVPWIRNSQGNLSKLHWLNLAVSHLLDSYSTDPKRVYIYKQDMTAFVSDLGWLLLEFGILDPAIKDIDMKRFFEADNFVFGSNGDFQIDIHELTNYGAFLYSIGNLSRRILDDVEPICAIPNGGFDRYKHPWLDPDCFRKEYFARYYRYWEKFPQMVAFFESLPPDQQKQVTQKIEAAARVHGFSNDPVGKLDIDNMAGVIHYIDAVFFRFDLDGSQRLDIDEVLAGYPKFKKIFAEYAHLDESQDFILKSAFTYLIRFGEPPQTTVAGYAKFIAWMAARPFWKTDADRMAMFNVFSSLAASASATSSP